MRHEVGRRLVSGNVRVLVKAGVSHSVVAMREILDRIESGALVHRVGIDIAGCFVIDRLVKRNIG